MVAMGDSPDGDGVTPARAQTGRVQSVDRALNLLDAVASASSRGETAAELAAKCDINRATAWRLLVTLEDHGLVERDPTTNRYKVGLALIRMSAAAGYDGLVRRTRPILERVSEQTGETASLATAGLHGVTYIGEVAPRSVLAVSWLAREVPLHATSTGRAFLAWLPQDEAIGMLEQPLPGFTDTTVTDLDLLLEELTRPAPGAMRSVRVSSKRRCTACQHPCWTSPTLGRWRSSASGVRSTGFPSRASPSSDRSRSRPPPRYAPSSRDDQALHRPSDTRLNPGLRS